MWVAARSFGEGEQNETSAPSFSASGRRRLCSLGAIADRQGTTLSDAANTPRGSISSGRSLRHGWPPVGRADEIPTGHGRHREYRWWRRFGRRGAGLPLAPPSLPPPASPPH